MVYKTAALIFLVAATLFAVQRLKAEGKLAHIYSVGAILNIASTQRSTVWAGKEVLVKGVIAESLSVSTFGSAEDPEMMYSLADPASPFGNTIALRWGKDDGLSGLVRNVPLLDRLVPPARRARLGEIFTYHVRLQSGGRCVPPPCLVAIVIGGDVLAP